MNERIKKGHSPEDAWNETSIEMVGAAEVNYLLVVTYFGTHTKTVIIFRLIVVPLSFVFLMI